MSRRAAATWNTDRPNNPARGMARICLCGTSRLIQSFFCLAIRSRRQWIGQTQRFPPGQYRSKRTPELLSSHFGRRNLNDQVLAFRPFHLVNGFRFHA